MRVGLVSCAAKKLDHAAAAQDLYVSNLFRKSSSYARDAYERWFILSAKWGLVEPTMRLSPYDETLNTKTRTERDDWGLMVANQLRMHSLGGAELFVHAGRHYREPLERQGLTLLAPLAGLGIGQQLTWYKARGY